MNLIARCESAAVHGRLVREPPHALQPAVRARLEIGLRVSAPDYRQATRLRDEVTVLRVGHASEQAAGWWRRRPPLD